MDSIVIYARYSSDRQTEQSIEGQLRVCEEYAKRNNLKVIKTYIDRAMTGTNDNRPEFLQMIEDSKMKLFKYILVYKLDRFSRNKYDNAIYKHKLAQNGVRVISATEAISDTPEGLLLEGLLEMFAELYSKDLSQKVKRGMRESALKGNYFGGVLPYGYAAKNKKIVVDKEKAEIVKYIFEEYAGGRTKKELVNELNRKGLKGSLNKPFTANSFNRMLSNKKYIGVYESENGEISNDNFFPAIIDKETFDRVQEKLKQNKRMPGKQCAIVDYILTGKLYCGCCGSAMVGASGTSKTGSKYFYYVCSKRHKKNACHKKYEHKEELETEVIKQTLQFLLDDEQLEEIAEGVLSEYSSNITTLKIKEYNRQIKRVDDLLEDCYQRFKQTKNETIIKKINAEADFLCEQKEDLENEKKKLEIASKINHTKQDILQYLKMFINGDFEDINYKKKIIEYFINSVYVYDDKIAIYYNLFGEHKITLEESNEIIEQSEKVRTLNTQVHHCANCTNLINFVFNQRYFGKIVKRQVE